MPTKIKHRSILAENSCATHRTQQRDRNKGKARGDGVEALVPKSGRRVGGKEERRQGSRKIGNSKVAKVKEDVRAATLLRSSQETP